MTLLKRRSWGEFVFVDRIIGNEMVVKRKQKIQQTKERGNAVKKKRKKKVVKKKESHEKARRERLESCELIWRMYLCSVGLFCSGS